MDLKTVHILGINLDRGTFGEIIGQCEKWLTDSAVHGHQIVTVNPEFIMEAQKNEGFRHVLNTVDFRITDGVGLVMGSLLLYGLRNRLHRCTGVDMTWQLVKLCFKYKKKIYLVGALDGIAKGIAVRAATVIEKKFPGVIVGAEDALSRSGSVESSIQDTALCERINIAKPDILLVAIGAPRQDVWIADHIGTLPSIRIALGIGGTLDYIAGVIPRAPRWVRKLGFEWFYRLVHQPHRWNRIVTATIRYPVALIRQKYFNN